MTLRLSAAAVACLALAASLLGGCASAARPEAISTTLVMPAHQSTADVSVTVVGGNAAEISNDAFVRALGDSIERSGIFAKVSPSGARYQLKARIGSVDHPAAGVSFTVKMDVSYTLIDRQTSTAVWTQTIPSEHTAHLSDAMLAATRLRRAEEGAAKANIEQALTQIATLNLP
jgi:secreted trypsin-like serine protease